MQYSLLDKKTKKRYSRSHYGGETKGFRKLERPFHSRRSNHVVLKSEKAKGKLSFLTAANRIAVREILYHQARRFGVVIQDLVNAGNHLHIKAKCSSRVQFQKFLKASTGLIARRVTGARKGKAFGRFWQGLAYTRVLKTSFEELRLRGYFDANRIEIKQGRLQREEFLTRFNAWIRNQRKGTDRAPPPAWA